MRTGKDWERKGDWRKGEVRGRVEWEREKGLRKWVKGRRVKRDRKGSGRG